MISQWNHIFLSNSSMIQMFNWKCENFELSNFEQSLFILNIFIHFKIILIKIQTILDTST